MDIFSIIFLVILAFFIFFCGIKGFIRSIISFSKGIVSFIIATILCRPFANFLMNLPTSKSSENGIISWLIKQSPKFNQIVYPGDYEVISDALKSLSIPGFLSDIIGKSVNNTLPSEGIILSESIAQSIMYLILSVISFVILIIAIRFLLFILRRSIKGILDNLPTIKKIDRIIGIIFGIIVSVFVIDGICFVLMGLISIPGLDSFAKFINNTMQLNTNTFTISKFFYEHNILLLIFH